MTRGNALGQRSLGQFRSVLGKMAAKFVARETLRRPNVQVRAPPLRSVTAPSQGGVVQTLCGSRFRRVCSRLTDTELVPVRRLVVAYLETRGVGDRHQPDRGTSGCRVRQESWPSLTD